MPVRLLDSDVTLLIDVRNGRRWLVRNCPATNVLDGLAKELSKDDKINVVDARSGDLYEVQGEGERDTNSHR